MAVTIKYKDLSMKLMMAMTIAQLVSVREQIVEEVKALTAEDWETIRTKQELVAQAGVISAVIDKKKSEKIEYHCEKCGEPTIFSKNMCEDCFDNEVDRYYDGGRDEDE